MRDGKGVFIMATRSVLTIGAVAFFLASTNASARVDTLDSVANSFRLYDKEAKFSDEGPLLGQATREKIAAKDFVAAKALLETEANKTSSNEVIHWWLAKIAIEQKKFREFRKHLKLAEKLPLLKNTKLARELYDSLPTSERDWLIKELLQAGYVDAKIVSSCPYFQLSQRKARAELLYIIAMNHSPSKKVRDDIYQELFVALPEAKTLNELKELKGFDGYVKHVDISDLIKRMDQLAIFGQNSEARSTFELRSMLKKPPSKEAEICELEYADAKVDRKMRKYDAARARFKSLTTRCPEDVKTRAKYLDLMLASQRGDESSLPEFSAFVEQNKEHSFADDVLLFKANLLLDKGRAREALVALDQIVEHYERGDMIERALFLKAYVLAKAKDTAGALEALRKLEKITVPTQLEHAQAQYWIARLAIFEDVTSLAKPIKKNLDTAKKVLYDLVNWPTPNVYSWLAFGMLSHLGEKVVINKKEVDGREGKANQSKELNAIESIILQGFRDEALAILDDLVVRVESPGFSARMARFYEVLNRPEAAHQKLVRCNFAAAENLRREAPAHFEKIAFPRPFAKEVAFAVNKVDVPENVVFAIMRQESGFIPESMSFAGAKGLMQLMYSSALPQATVWGIENLQEKDLYTPDVNVLLGASILQKYWQQFGSVVAGLAAYNAGPNMASAWFKKKPGLPFDAGIEEISFKETREYVKSVLGNLFSYAVLDKNGFAKDLSLSEVLTVK